MKTRANINKSYTFNDCDASNPQRWKYCERLTHRKRKRHTRLTVRMSEKNIVEIVKIYTVCPIRMLRRNS